jgi:hypothetical protein
MLSRTWSAVLVHTNGRGCSFQVTRSAPSVVLDGEAWTVAPQWADRSRDGERSAERVQFDDPPPAY